MLLGSIENCELELGVCEFQLESLVLASSCVHLPLVAFTICQKPDVARFAVSKGLRENRCTLHFKSDNTTLTDSFCTAPR